MSSFTLCLGLVLSSFGVGKCLRATFLVPGKLTLRTGAGITTTLISLIANAGPENQAVATAGTLTRDSDELHAHHAILQCRTSFVLWEQSYGCRFPQLSCKTRSAVIYRSACQERMWTRSEFLDSSCVLSRLTCASDRPACPGVPGVHRRARAGSPRKGDRVVRGRPARRDVVHQCDNGLRVAVVALHKREAPDKVRGSVASVQLPGFAIVIAFASDTDRICGRRTESVVLGRLRALLRA